MEKPLLIFIFILPIQLTKPYREPDPPIRFIKEDNLEPDSNLLTPKQLKARVLTEIILLEVSFVIFLLSMVLVCY